MKPAPSHPQAPRKPPRRRAPDAVHLAVVDATSGAAGTPTPTERQAIYLALLRKGEPPPKWISRQAAAWGISSVVVGDELVIALLDKRGSGWNDKLSITISVPELTRMVGMPRA